MAVLPRSPSASGTGPTPPRSRRGDRGARGRLSTLDSRAPRHFVLCDRDLISVLGADRIVDASLVDVRGAQCLSVDGKQDRDSVRAVRALVVGAPRARDPRGACAGLMV